MTATNPRARRSGVVVPHRPKWHGEIAACAIWLAGTALARTWHLTLENESGFSETYDQPLIGAIWHNRLAVAMPVWKWWRGRNKRARLAALISASRDGALLARTFSYFGVKPIRGSSSRRGAQALIELTSAIKDKFTVAITPDGPRGPKYVVQPGIIALAQLTGTPIVPIGVFIERKKQLRSWDGFQIPYPFTKCHARLGPPIRIARDATAEEQELARQQLETSLRHLNPD